MKGGENNMVEGKFIVPEGFTELLTEDMRAQLSYALVTPGWAGPDGIEENVTLQSVDRLPDGWVLSEDFVVEVVSPIDLSTNAVYRIAHPKGHVVIIPGGNTIEVWREEDVKVLYP